MRRSTFVVDTNVLVAGLLTKGSSPVSRIVDGMLMSTFRYAISTALLREYRMVLVRPGLLRVHRLGIAGIDDILTDIVLHAVMIEPQRSAHRAPDPGDQFLYDLLAIRADLVLITGDQKLLNHAAISGRILSPRQFIESM